MAENELDYTLQELKYYLQWSNSLQRDAAVPLDRSSLHPSYVAALDYAAGPNADGGSEDERKLSNTAYIGQIITVIQSEKDEQNNIEPGIWVYKLVPSKIAGRLADLEQVGIETESISMQEIYEILDIDMPANL